METINYWESRKINIGHYEDIQFGLTYTKPVIAKEINNSDRMVEISHKEQVEMSSLEDFNKSVMLAVKRVRSVLDARERKIRTAVATIDMDIELDHLEKLKAMNIEVSKEVEAKRVKLKKKKIENSISDDEFDE